MPENLTSSRVEITMKVTNNNLTNCVRWQQLFRWDQNCQITDIIQFQAI